MSQSKLIMTWFFFLYIQTLCFSLFSSTSSSHKKSLFSIAFPFLLFVYFLIFIVCLRFIVLMLFLIVISYVVIFYAYSLFNFFFWCLFLYSLFLIESLFMFLISFVYTKKNCFYGSFDLFKTDNNKTNIL